MWISRFSALEKTPLILLTIAFLLYALLWTSAPIITVDSSSYQEVAQDIQNSQLIKFHFRTPGYPLLLYFTGSEASPTKYLFYVQLLLYITSVAFLIDALKMLNFNFLWINLFCIIALVPQFVVHSAYVMSETLTGFFLVAAFWCILRAKQLIWYGLTGILIGLAAFTRPTYQLLGIIIAVFLIFWQKKVKNAFWVFLLSSLLVGGFASFNLIRFGHFGLTPALGFNLSTRTANCLERMPEGSLRNLLITARNNEWLKGETHSDVMYIWSVKTKELSDLVGRNEADLGDYMLRLNIKLILSGPLIYLHSVFYAIGDYWFPFTTKLIYFRGSTKIQISIALFHFIILFLFVYLFIAISGTSIIHGLSPSVRPLLFPYMIAMLVIIYTMIISCFIDVGYPRYRVPTDTLILLCTFLGFKIMVQERRYLTENRN